MFAFKVLTNTTPTQHPSLVICSSCDRSNCASHWRYFAWGGFVGVVSRAVWCAFRLRLRTQDNVYRQRKRFSVRDRERQRNRYRAHHIAARLHTPQSPTTNDAHNSVTYSITDLGSSLVNLTIGHYTLP